MNALISYTVSDVKVALFVPLVPSFVSFVLQNAALVPLKINSSKERTTVNQFFLTGIGTEIGKTVVAATLVEALHADYWKPIQSGDLDHTDSMKIQNWISNPHTRIHPERFRLNSPLSPHASAAIDGVEIKVRDFQLPDTTRPLIVEGAGGLMVPVNHRETMLGLIQHLNLPVILVGRTLAQRDFADSRLYAADHDRAWKPKR